MAKEKPENKAAKEIFQYWQAVMGKSKARLTPGRKTKIKTRLKNYSVADIKQAIDGCRASAFHMGANDNRTQYNDLTLICRSDEKLEGFMEKAGSSPGGPGPGKQDFVSRVTDRSWSEE